MPTNLILDELHATRAKLLAQAGGDLHRYVVEAKARALASGRPIAIPTQRKICCAVPVNESIAATEAQSLPVRDRYRSHGDG